MFCSEKNRNEKLELWTQKTQAHEGEICRLAITRFLGYKDEYDKVTLLEEPRLLTYNSELL